VYSNKLLNLLFLSLICLSFGQKALAVDPEVLAKKALCHSCLAKIYVAQNQVGPATIEFQELLKLTPNDASAHFDFGNLLARNNKPDLAAVQFKAAAKLKPSIPEYQVGLGNALMYTKNYDGAVQAYTKACALGGKYQTQLQTAQQYQAQQRLLNQYKEKIEIQKESDE
jgi:Flp pilus assembly protein TadD